MFIDWKYDLAVLPQAVEEVSRFFEAAHFFISTIIDWKYVFSVLFLIEIYRSVLIYLRYVIQEVLL